MTSKGLSLFLVGSILIFIVSGCSPERDLYIYLLNSTNEKIEICNTSELTFCNEIPVNSVDFDAAATKGNADEFFEEILYTRIIKLCNRVIPLNKLILPPMKRKDGDKTIYQLIIPQEYYDRECGAGLTPQPST